MEENAKRWVKCSHAFAIMPAGAVFKLAGNVYII